NYYLASDPPRAVVREPHRHPRTAWARGLAKDRATLLARSGRHVPPQSLRAPPGM
ncbi:MAG: hypothetical protein AVDCRST_MAG14-159, partial [uncultured Rubrobacteraceae bacterium]